MAEATKPPAWYLNLVANPEVQVEIGWSRKRYRARTLGDEKTKRLWPEILKGNPLYACYQWMTSRRIPIVELVPERSQARLTVREPSVERRETGRRGRGRPPQ
jgi:hypothetical protein